MVLPIQISILAWLLTVGLGEKTDSKVQNNKGTNGSIKTPATEKDEFTTVENLTAIMAAKLKNNAELRRNAIIANKVQLAVILGIWALLCFIWVSCNVKMYLERKRNIRRLKKQYKEAAAVMLEDKRQELENAAQAEANEKKRRQNRRRGPGEENAGAVHLMKVMQYTKPKEDRAAPKILKRPPKGKAETSAETSEYDEKTYHDTEKANERRGRVVSAGEKYREKKPPESVPESGWSEDIKKLRERRFLLENKVAKTEYDNIFAKEGEEASEKKAEEKKGKKKSPEKIESGKKMKKKDVAVKIEKTEKDTEEKSKEEK